MIQFSAQAIKHINLQYQMVNLPSILVECILMGIARKGVQKLAVHLSCIIMMGNNS